jgi:DNA replication protein DnaC
MSNAEDNYRIQRLKEQIVLSCPKCKGYGTPCSCQEEFKLEVKKVFAHIPLKYRDFTLDMINEPQVLPAKKLVETYINNINDEKLRGGGLYLWGHNKGTAKTAFSCITLIEALKKGYTAYFTDLDECVSAIMDGWFDASKRGDFEKYVIESDFLVIDDIGGMEIKTKGNKEVIATALTSLFKKRANALRPTILTSNLDLNDIDDVFGERLFSIMHEHLTIVECAGMDFRKSTIGPNRNKK